MNLRFQFSLRTLMFAALLLGSGATLWWNWPAWRPEKTYLEDGPINAAGFTPDTKHFFSCTRITAAGEKTASLARFNVRKTATGELVKSLTMPAGKYDFLAFSPNCQYAWHFDSGEQYGRQYGWSHELWRTDTWELLSNERRDFLLSPDGSRAVAYTPSKNTLAYCDFPSCAPRWELPLAAWRKVSFSPSGKYLEFHDGAKLTLYATEDGHTACSSSVAGETFIVKFSPGEDRIAVSHSAQNSKLESTRILALPNLNELWTCPGYAYDISKNWKYAFMHDDDTATRLSPTTRRYRCWEIGAEKALWTGNFGFGNLRFTADEERLIAVETTSIGSDGATRVVDVRSGQTIWSTPASFTQFQDSHLGGDLCIVTGEKPRILESRTGKEVFAFIDPRLPAPETGKTWDVTASAGAAELLTHDYSREGRGNRLLLWRKHRPANAWGILYMAEFWIAIALGCGFVWSIVKDRRALHWQQTAAASATQNARA